MVLTWRMGLAYQGTLTYMHGDKYVGYEPPSGATKRGKRQHSARFCQLQPANQTHQTRA